MLRWDFLCWVCWIDVDTTPWKSIPNSLKTLLDTIYILSKIHTFKHENLKDILYWFGLETLFKMVWFENSVFFKWFCQETLFWNGLVRKLCFEMVWSGHSVLKWFGMKTLFWNGLVRKLCFIMVWFGNSVFKWFGQETLFLSWFGLETLFWNGLVWNRSMENAGMEPVSAEKDGMAGW